VLTSEIGQLGRTKLYTRWDIRLRYAAALLTLLGAAAAFAVGTAVIAQLSGADQVWPVVTFRSIAGGEGALVDPTGTSTAHLEFPAALTLPQLDPWWPVLLVVLPLFALWMRYVVGRLLRRFNGEARHRGLATPAEVRKHYGTRTVRRTTRFTRPTLTRWQRFLLPTGACGIDIGAATTPKVRGKLRVDLEQRIRIVARPGWGKSKRLLQPITRALTGPALVSSTEPEAFTATVVARQFRAAPSRIPWRRAIREYPIAVVECAPVDHRVAGGYPAVRWNPILGCRNYKIATRRAAALVKGVDEESGGDSSATSRWFEDGATKVLAAFLHAASWDDTLELASFAEWLATDDYSRPVAILRAHKAVADPAALLGSLRNLDPEGGRTTSNLKVSVAAAVASLTSSEGAAVCGLRAEPQFDMENLITSGGTLYLIAEPDEMKMARPLLSLLATEMFLAAEQVARATKAKRLPEPFYGVLDELRYGVRVANLEYVANTMRKFGVSYVYCVTNGADEAAVYGPSGAALLKAVAGVSIYGGMDEASAADITDRAGQTPVVTAARAAYGASENIHQFDAITAADLQRLGDGESVIMRAGMPPVFARTRATHESGRLRRRIRRETAQVAAQHLAAMAEAPVHPGSIDPVTA